MIEAWRIVKSRRATTAFDGEGARINGGRWNSPGRPAVYASGTRALAILEILAGLGTTTVLPSYSLIGVSFDDSLVEDIDLASLPSGWHTYPPGAASQSVGDTWLVEGATPVLRVPSALVPVEPNYVLNPRHKDFGAITIGAPEVIPIDPRLVRP